MSSLTNEIKADLAQFVGGTMTPEEFQASFALTLRDVHESEDSEAESLAHAIEWAFCDLERGDSTESVRLKLAALAASQSTVVFQYGSNQRVSSLVLTGTSSAPMPQGMAVGQLVGVGPALEYA